MPPFSPPPPQALILTVQKKAFETGLNLYPCERMHRHLKGKKSVLSEMTFNSFHQGLRALEGLIC